MDAQTFEIQEDVRHLPDPFKPVDEAGLDQETAAYIKAKFLPFLEKAAEWREKAFSLKVTSEDQVREMKMAREARLAIKSLRVEADKTRAALKENSLRLSQAIQGTFNVIKAVLEPMEEHLLEQEKFAERQREARMAELRAIREDEVQPYREFIPYGIPLEELSMEDYQKMLEAGKIALKAKREAEEAERIEAERQAAIAKLRAERTEQIKLLWSHLPEQYRGMDFGEVSVSAWAAILDETRAAKEAADAEKLRMAAEAAAARAEAEAQRREREAAEKEAKEKLAAEQAERKRLEDAEKARKAAEEKERKAREAEARRLAKAPDQEKIRIFASTLKEMMDHGMPNCGTQEGQQMVGELTEGICLLYDKAIKFATQD